MEVWEDGWTEGIRAARTAPRKREDDKEKGSNNKDETIFVLGTVSSKRLLGQAFTLSACQAPGIVLSPSRYKYYKTLPSTTNQQQQQQQPQQQQWVFFCIFICAKNVNLWCAAMAMDEMENLLPFLVNQGHVRLTLEQQHEKQRLVAEKEATNAELSELKAELAKEEESAKLKKFAPHPPRLQHPEGVPPALPPGGLVFCFALGSLPLRPRLARLLELAEPAS
ncbi:hypothetical protein CPLU01_14671 [Colletotrichum plurivorum]|uniref:Uncharacterized protein n=1 Tax=Colletotrichum plurivorum TaxID=2175906 RepID=A0A8H6JHL9_9PEZI|nr:hypothetical protein CPLU01_14671 [Colletotrichum plurivorum]